MLKKALLFFQQYPYLLLILAAVLLVIFSFSDHHQTVDIHVYDTMFIISGYLVYWLISFCLVVTAGLYAGLKRFLPNPVLTWTHILLTLLLLSIAAFFVNYYNNIYTNARGDNSPASILHRAYYINTSEAVYGWLIVLFLAVQFVLIAHVIGGITQFIRKK